MLSNAVRAAHPDQWADYMDHTGDGESGDCIYSASGSMHSAPYKIEKVGDKVAAHVDTANAKKVIPHVSYVQQAEDDDHYSTMEAAKKGLYAGLPMYERFIAKSERDAAGEDSFAGKGKSYPILKREDVKAAVHAMGRAGAGNYGMAQLKANIIRIAKAKGWSDELPKAWQDSGADSKESASPTTGAVRLVESAMTLDPIVLREARADYEIKLIAPGKGSSAFYPAEVLRRDGPSVFKAGTHVYVNHPTLAEEAQRPEGDVKNLAGVLATDAVYHESHAKGPGLYARMKVFADHGQMVEEKAAHVGMSIRACGEREAAGKTKDGVPILARLTSAESVDIVTKAGAGGLILTEAARDAVTVEGEDDMSEQEKQELREAARVVREGAARQLATALLADVSLFPVAKNKVIEAAVASMPMKDGALDREAFTTLVRESAKREGEYLAELLGTGRVMGMGGGSAPTASTEADRKALKEARKRNEELTEAQVDVFADLMGNRKAAEYAVKGVAA